MTDLLKRLEAKLEFDEASAHETAKIVVSEIEALCWADNWSVHKGIPRVSERLAYHHAKLRPIHKALMECVGSLQILRNEVRGTLHAHELAIRYDSGNSNWNCLELALERAENALEAALREGGLK